jgi:hypothetical protein
MCSAGLNKAVMMNPEISAVVISGRTPAESRKAQDETLVTLY